MGRSGADEAYYANRKTANRSIGSYCPQIGAQYAKCTDCQTSNQAEYGHRWCNFDMTLKLARPEDATLQEYWMMESHPVQSKLLAVSPFPCLQASIHSQVSWPPQLA